MSESYLEKCINSLPPEKQPAAREAFKAIAENGDDNLISKLLVILEATSAYAVTVPQTLSASGERFLGDWDARLAKATQVHAEQESAREERLGQLLAKQVPALGKALALDKVAVGLQGQAAELGRIERSLARLRHARVGGLLLLMLLGVLLGAGAVVGLGWRSYQGARQAEKFVVRLNDAGIVAKIRRTETGELLTIEGPEVLRGTVWRKDDKGYIIGADIVYPIQEAR
jgi:hypothetical protein